LLSIQCMRDLPGLTCTVYRCEGAGNVERCLGIILKEGRKICLVKSYELTECRAA
jgi:hypothetical protein